MPMQPDPGGIDCFDCRFGSMSAFFKDVKALLGEKDSDRLTLLGDLHGHTLQGAWDRVETILDQLDPRHPMRQRAVEILALARYPHLAAGYLLPRKWYPGLMLHTPGEMELPGIKTDRCGCRLPETGPAMAPHTLVIGDDLGFAPGLPYARSLAGRLKAVNGSILDSNLVQKLAGFELLAPAGVSTLLVVEGPFGLYSSLLWPMDSRPPLPPLFHEDQFRRMFRGMQSFAPALANPGVDRERVVELFRRALQTLFRVARKRGVQHLMGILAPMVAADPPGNNAWEQNMARVARLSGHPLFLLPCLEETQDQAIRYRQALAEVCQGEGVVFMDTSNFRAPPAIPTFTDFYRLTPTAHDLWLGQILEHGLVPFARQ